MHKLQSDMQAKRREAYELEDQMGADNPPVFAAVQVGLSACSPFTAVQCNDSKYA
jgi:hypothetical protein